MQVDLAASTFARLDARDLLERNLVFEAADFRQEPASRVTAGRGSSWTDARFLYLGLGRSGSAIFIGSLDHADQPRRLMQASSNVAPLGANHLVIARGQSLIAQPIDPVRLELAGESALIANTLAFLEDRRAGVFSASANGTAASWSHPAPRTRIAWLNRAGQPTEPPRDIDGRVVNLALSPDNRRIALERLDPANGADDIWIFDRARESLTRVTTEPSNDTDPVWSPDGLSLLFSSPRRVGSGAGNLPTFPEDWSRRHHDILVVQGSECDRQLRRVSLREDQRDRPDSRTTPLVEDRYLKDEPRESPDGRFVAYHSMESGRAEVYVIDRGRAPRKWQVSIDGGVQARWNEAVTSCSFWASTACRTSPRVRVTRDGSARARCFQTGLRPHLTLEQYAVARDGQHFVVASPVADPIGPISILINALP